MSGTHQDFPEIGSAVRHVKRGTTYSVIAIIRAREGCGPTLADEMSVSGHDVAKMTPDHVPTEALSSMIGVQTETPGAEIWAIYRGDAGDSPDYWMRPMEEFPGRFVAV